MFRDADQGGRIHRRGLGKHSVDTAPESKSQCLFIDQTRIPVSREIRHHSVAHLPTFDLRSKLGDFTGTVGQRDNPRSAISRITPLATIYRAVGFKRAGLVLVDGRSIDIASAVKLKGLKNKTKRGRTTESPECRIWSH
jgi:hypothetical protein